MDWIELILRGPCFVPDEINEENKFFHDKFPFCKNWFKTWNGTNVVKKK